jgi:hypothetical protein
MSGGDCVPRCTHGPSTMRPGAQFRARGFTSREHMNSRICRCCGEPMPEKGNALSRNPNICASCSSMADGMEESFAGEGAGLAPAEELPHATTEGNAAYRVEKKAA